MSEPKVTIFTERSLLKTRAEHSAVAVIMPVLAALDDVQTDRVMQVLDLLYGRRAVVKSESELTGRVSPVIQALGVDEDDRKDS